MRTSFLQSAGVVALATALLTSAAACTSGPQAAPSPSPRPTPLARSAPGPKSESSGSPSPSATSPSPPPSATSTVPISAFAGDWYTSNGALEINWDYDSNGTPYLSGTITMDDPDIAPACSQAEWSADFNAFPQLPPNGNAAKGAVTDVEVIETGKAPYLSQGEALSLTLSKNLSTLTTAGPGDSHRTVWSPQAVC